MAVRPAHLPDPRVGTCARRSSRHSSRLTESRQAWSDASSPCSLRECEGVDDLAVDVELDLLGGGVADPDRASSPRSPGASSASYSVEPPLAGHAVHDLEVGRGAGGCAEQPLPPPPRLVQVAGVDQRDEGERRVAQPAVAVVPVARAADPLGEGGRRRGDDPAGRLVDQALQHAQRRAHGLGPVPVVGAAAGPLVPERLASPRGRCSTSTGSGGSACEANQVRANGRRSPAETVVEPTLVKSLPSSSMWLSIRTAFGPTTARRVVVDAGATRGRPTRTRTGARAPCGPPPRRRTPSTIRARTVLSRPGGMKSIRRTTPSSVSNVVSRTSVSGR